MRSYNNNGGYKINIKGKASSQEIIEHLASELLNLQKNFGIEEFSGINFYCQIHKDDDYQFLVSKEDNSIITGTSTKSDNSHKTVEKTEDGKKQISYNKSIDFDNLESSVSELIETNIISSDKHQLLSLSEIRAKQKRIEEEQEKLRREEYKRLKEQQFIFQKKREQEEKLLSQFKEKIKADFNISNDDEFRITISSFAPIVCQRTIRKYLGEQDQYDEKYFRVTLKNKKTQKAGDIYIYNLNLEQLKHIEKGA